MWAVGVLTDQGDVMFCQRSLYESCRMGRRIDPDSLICSFGHCECDGHTVHKPNQRRLTADWLAPRESDCSRTRSKVSSDWLPSYFKATRTVLELFKMAGYFPDRPRTSIYYLSPVQYINTKLLIAIFQSCTVVSLASKSTSTPICKHWQYS